MQAHLIAAALAVAFAAGHAQAQTSGGAKKHAAKPVATKSAAKPAASKHKVPAKAAKAVEAMTPVQSLSERLSEAELEIAQHIYTGTIQCELGANVTVTADEKNPGFFHITTGKQSYYMHPVESRTGAIRMEDNRAGAMWLQLGSKSMLMNQKLGQRIADECATPTQREVAARMRQGPQHSLLDAPKPRPAPPPPPPPPPEAAASSPEQPSQPEAQPSQPEIPNLWR